MSTVYMHTYLREFDEENRLEDQLDNMAVVMYIKNYMVMKVLICIMVWEILTKTVALVVEISMKMWFGRL